MFPGMGGIHHALMYGIHSILPREHSAFTAAHPKGRGKKACKKPWKSLLVNNTRIRNPKFARFLDFLSKNRANFGFRIWVLLTSRDFHGFLHDFVHSSLFGYTAVLIARNKSKLRCIFQSLKWQEMYLCLRVLLEKTHRFGKLRLRV